MAYSEKSAARLAALHGELKRERNMNSLRRHKGMRRHLPK